MIYTSSVIQLLDRHLGSRGVVCVGPSHLVEKQAGEDEADKRAKSRTDQHQDRLDCVCVCVCEECVCVCVKSVCVCV